MTLLEVAVAMALLVVAAVLVLPSIGPLTTREPVLRDVVVAARATAIARAQTIDLHVAPSGAWELRALPPDETALRTGTLRTGPSSALQLRITALGACLNMRGAVAATWDAALCRETGSR